MATLTRDYIKQHEHDIHTFESFGRLVVDLAIKETERIVGDGEAEKVKFTLEFEVSPYEPKDCLKICVKSFEGTSWCINQANGEMEP